MARVTYCYDDGKILEVCWEDGDFHAAELDNDDALEIRAEYDILPSLTDAMASIEGDLTDEAHEKAKQNE